MILNADNIIVSSRVKTYIKKRSEEIDGMQE